jgi:hypothetical protein
LVVPPLIPRSRKLRTGLLVTASLAVVAVVALLLANTADSGNKKAKGTSSTAPASKNGLKLQLGLIHVQSAGPRAPLRSPLRRLVLASAQTYVNSAILAPLERGQVGADYLKLFDPFVKTTATHADRPALTEAGTGLVNGSFHATASHVRLDGLGDPTGNIALVAASFTMKIEAPTPTGLLTIARATELTFANEFGKWVVTAYNVGVRRTINHSTTASTAHTGSKAPQ